MSQSLGVWAEVHRFENLSGDDHAGSSLIAGQILIVLVGHFPSRDRTAVSLVVGGDGIQLVLIRRHFFSRSVCYFSEQQKPVSQRSQRCQVQQVRRRWGQKHPELVVL